jgi:hypothetical protein
MLGIELKIHGVEMVPLRHARAAVAAHLIGDQIAVHFGKLLSLFRSNLTFGNNDSVRCQVNA